MSRKILIILLGITLVLSLSLAGFSQKYQAEYEGPVPTAYGEAPSLSDLVAEGELPPVEERLPQTPLVINVADEIGAYGGIWDRVHTSPGMGQWQITNHYEPLVRWKTDLSGYAPGTAKNWEFNEDGTEFTLHLRKGLRWSDGAEVTTADFMFWWEDMILNEEFPDAPPHWMTRAGEPAKVEAIDDYTLKFTFAAPNWIFPGQLAQGHWRTTPIVAFTPKHYLKQFHPEYNSELENYEELDEKTTDIHQNPDYPTLGPWHTVKYSEGKVLEAERNPYYYVVDTEGNQLPYIDRVISRRVSDAEAQLLKTIDGTIDAKFRQYHLRDFTVLKKNEVKGNYRVILWERGDGGSPMIFLNWDHDDPQYRELFRNHNFRVALSHAIDREYINNVVYRGLGTIQNVTMSEFLMHYLYHPEGPEAGKELHEEWADAYAEYDLEKAKNLLDEAGYVDQDGDGWRDFKDGTTIKLLLDTNAQDVLSIDANTLIAEDWEEAGVKTEVNSISGAKMQMRLEESTMMFKTFGYGSEVDLLTYPDNVFPVAPTRFHPRTGQWYETGGEEGLEPTGPMKKLLDIYQEALELKSPENHQKILEAVRVTIEEGPFAYCPVARLPSIAVAKETMHNVPEFGITGPWAPGFPGAIFPGQFYFEEGAQARQ